MSTKPPGGTRDFLPTEIKRREYVMRVVRDVYERYGFEPLETPAFENIDTLLGKYGDEGNKLIFKILRRGEHESSGGADLALRYDLTVPLARVVAQYQSELPRFFKRYQMQPVWRADRPAKGRFREFYQCDVDAIGSTSAVVEIEVCCAATDVLNELGFQQFLFRVNHRQVLAGILECVGVPEDKHASALTAVDKLDKVGPEGVRAELAQREIAEAAADFLVNLFKQQSESMTELLKSVAGHPNKPFPPQVLQNANWKLHEHLKAFIVASPNGRAGIDKLGEILQHSQSTSFGNHALLDVSLARGLSYYTGAIMEIAVPDLAGSLGGGGRYDNLVGMFLGRDIPACGFSLGLERIIVVMTERNMFPAKVAHAAMDVMVTLWNPPARSDQGALEAGGGVAKSFVLEDSLALAATLRSAGLRVDVYPDADKLGKQFKYASSRQIAFVAVLGDEERARGEVSVKDLRTGEQQSVPRVDVAGYIRARLTASSESPVSDARLIPNP